LNGVSVVPTAEVRITTMMMWTGRGSQEPDVHLHHCY